MLKACFFCLIFDLPSANTSFIGHTANQKPPSEEHLRNQSYEPFRLYQLLYTLWYPMFPLHQYLSIEYVLLYQQKKQVMSLY